jgi:hypothetical protein
VQQLNTSADPERTTTMTTDESTVRELFAAIDAGDITRVLSLLTQDVRFQFGNWEPTAGHDGFAASPANRQIQAEVARVSHDLTRRTRPRHPPGRLAAPAIGPWPDVKV